jgi:O-antigen/teichoic acid export membrane protein
MPKKQHKNSITKNIVQGSAWMISMNWGIRTIGLVNTVILARLLSPEDFGVFAMGAVVLSLIEAFSDPGVEMLIIREKNPDRSHYDTAWTIVFIQKMAVAVILLLVAPLGATFFKEPRAPDVIRCLAIVAAISSFRNIGVVLFHKELEFSKVFWFKIYTRLGRFFIVIPIAIMLQSYWSLVIGAIVGIALEVFMSYWVHPYRPKFSLSKIRFFSAFSLRIVAIRIAQFFSKKIDIFVVGRLVDSSLLGVYNVSMQVSRMLTSEIVGPVNQALFPNYAKIVNEKNKLSISYLNSLSAISIILFPVGLGLSAVSDDVVLILLGEKWLDAIPFMKWMAVYAIGEGLLQVISMNILIVTGNESVSLRLAWFRLFLMSICISYAGYYVGVSAIPIAATLAIWSLIPLAILMVSRAVGIVIYDFLSALLRPIISSLAMFTLLAHLPVDTLNPFVRLLAMVLTGGIIYTTILLALWLVSGRPVGPESIVTRYIRKRFL